MHLLARTSSKRSSNWGDEEKVSNVEDEFKKEKVEEEKKKPSNTPKINAETGLRGIPGGTLLRRRGSVLTHSNFKAEARQKVIPAIFVEAKIGAVD